MPLSRETLNLVTQASGCSIWVCADTPKNLDFAAKSGNPASALAALRGVEADLVMLQARVSDAIYSCERELRSDEEAPAPKLRLVR